MVTELPLASDLVRKSPNSSMGPNFHVSAEPTFVTEFSSISERLNIKLVAISRSFSRLCSLILIIMDKYGFKVLYVSLKGHIPTTATIIFKLSSMFENSVTEVGEAETLKFRSILTELRS